MTIKEILKYKINNNYHFAATILNTSEWGAKEIIENDGETSEEDGTFIINLKDVQTINIKRIDN